MGNMKRYLFSSGRGNSSQDQRLRRRSEKVPFLEGIEPRTRKDFRLALPMGQEVLRRDIEWTYEAVSVVVSVGIPQSRSETECNDRAAPDARSVPLLCQLCNSMPRSPRSLSSSSPLPHFFFLMPITFNLRMS